MAGGVSLREGSQGGFLDDAEAIIKSCKTAAYTYPGSDKSAQGLIVEFDVEGLDEPHVENYSSGAVEPTEDGTGFVKALSTKSKAKQFIDSLLKLDYPNVEADVHVFEGAKVHLKRMALPKMPGIDKEGDKDKTVLLVDKIIALPGVKGGKTSPKAAPAARSTTGAKSQTQSSAPSTQSNGSGDDAAISAVQEALAKVDGATSTVSKLQTAVFLAALKSKMPSAEATLLKKSITSEWLTANMEAGGWNVEGEEVSL